MSSETLEHLPRSAQLLADFAHYCEIKRGCHFFLDERGASKCRHPDSAGGCGFEECPVIKGGGG